MAKSNSDKVAYGLLLSYAGIEMLEGTLDSYTEVGINFSSRKSGASTMLNQFIPANRIISCVGKVGDTAVIHIKSDSIPIFRAGKKGKERPLSVTGVSPLGTSLLLSSSADFPVVIVAAELARFVGEEKNEDAPKRGRKAAATKEDKKPKKDAEPKAKGKVIKKDEWKD